MQLEHNREQICPSLSLPAITPEAKIAAIHGQQWAQALQILDLESRQPMCPVLFQPCQTRYWNGGESSKHDLAKDGTSIITYQGKAVNAFLCGDESIDFSIIGPAEGDSGTPEQIYSTSVQATMEYIALHESTHALTLAWHLTEQETFPELKKIFEQHPRTAELDQRCREIIESLNRSIIENYQDWNEGLAHLTAISGLLVAGGEHREQYVAISIAKKIGYFMLVHDSAPLDPILSGVITNYPQLDKHWSTIKSIIQIVSEARDLLINSHYGFMKNYQFGSTGLCEILNGTRLHRSSASLLHNPFRSYYDDDALAY